MQSQPPISMLDFMTRVRNHFGSYSYSLLRSALLSKHEQRLHQSRTTPQLRVVIIYAHILRQLDDTKRRSHFRTILPLICAYLAPCRQLSSAIAPVVSTIDSTQQSRSLPAHHLTQDQSSPLIFYLPYEPP